MVEEEPVHVDQGVGTVPGGQAVLAGGVGTVGQAQGGGHHLAGLGVEVGVEGVAPVGGE